MDFGLNLIGWLVKLEISGVNVATSLTCISTIYWIYWEFTEFKKMTSNLKYPRVNTIFLLRNVLASFYLWPPHVWILNFVLQTSLIFSPVPVRYCKLFPMCIYNRLPNPSFMCRSWEIKWLLVLLRVLVLSLHHLLFFFWGPCGQW